MLNGHKNIRLQTKNKARYCQTSEDVWIVALNINFARFTGYQLSIKSHELITVNVDDHVFRQI